MARPIRNRVLHRHGRHSNANWGQPMVWFDKQRKRFFVVPDEQPLPVGTFELRSLTGTVRHVEPEAAAMYEVSASEAAAQIDDQIDAAWTRAKAGLQSIIDGVRGRSDEEISDEEARNPLPDSLKDLIGVSLGQLQTDPEAAKRNVGKALDGMRNAALAFRDRAQQAAEAADPAGVVEERVSAVPEQLQAAADRLRAAVQDPRVTDAMATMGDRLRHWADRLREEGVISTPTAEPDPESSETPSEDPAD